METSVKSKSYHKMALVYWIQPNIKHFLPELSTFDLSYFRFIMSPNVRSNELEWEAVIVSIVCFSWSVKTGFARACRLSRFFFIRARWKKMVINQIGAISRSLTFFIICSSDMMHSRFIPTWIHLLKRQAEQWRLFWVIITSKWKMGRKLSWNN